uniref:leucine-rich repeat extensin-like protein 3 n=1 Tax=Podarcis muralis TaxID=64176 RepID=UPI0010A0B4FC|nr:leucine-rich repeat extensin-like protein 3 [Podarcis muralis]
MDVQSSSTPPELPFVLSSLPEEDEAKPRSPPARQRRPTVPPVPPPRTARPRSPSEAGASRVAPARLPGTCYSARLLLPPPPPPPPLASGSIPISLARSPPRLGGALLLAAEKWTYT